MQPIANALTESILLTIGLGGFLWMLYVAFCNLIPLAASYRFVLAYAFLLIITGVFIVGTLLRYSGTELLPNGRLPLPESLESIWPKIFILTGWVYMVMVGLRLIRIVRPLIVVYRTRYTTHPIAPPILQSIINQFSLQLGLAKKPILKLSGLVKSPATIGFLKPIILFPLAAVNHLNPRQVEAVLLHELAHIARHDYLLNLGIYFMETVLWFNPFTRLFLQELQAQREIACDDMVLGFKYPPKEYAAAIYSFATPANLDFSLQATGGQAPLQLLSRIQHIAGMPTALPKICWRHPGLLLLSLLVLTLKMQPASNSMLPVAKQTNAEIKNTVRSTQVITKAAPALVSAVKKIDIPEPKSPKTALPQSKELSETPTAPLWSVSYNQPAQEIEMLKQAYQLKATEWKGAVISLSENLHHTLDPIDSSLYPKTMQQLRQELEIELMQNHLNRLKLQLLLETQQMPYSQAETAQTPSYIAAEKTFQKLAKKNQSALNIDRKLNPKKYYYLYPTDSGYRIKTVISL